MTYNPNCQFYEVKRDSPYCRWHQSNIKQVHCDGCTYFSPKSGITPQKELEELSPESILPKDLTDKLRREK